MFYFSPLYSGPLRAYIEGLHLFSSFLIRSFSVFVCVGHACVQIWVIKLLDIISLCGYLSFKIQSISCKLQEIRNISNCSNIYSNHITMFASTSFVVFLSSFFAMILKTFLPYHFLEYWVLCQVQHGYFARRVAASN